MPAPVIASWNARSAGRSDGATPREPARADLHDLEHAGEVARGLRRPRAVAADLGARVRLGQIPLLDHVLGGFVEGHLVHVQARVDDDARRAEDRRLVLVEQVLRIGEESLLAHHALGIERPALVEVRRSEHAADRRCIALRHHQMPVVSGICLVHRGGRDAGAAVALQSLLNFFGGRAIGRVGDEEVAPQRVLECRRPLVRGDREDRPLERRRGLDGALLALRQRDQRGVSKERARLLRPLLVFRAHAFGGRRVDLVQSITGLLPRPAVDLLRDAVRLRGEQVPLLAALLAQCARVEREQLLLLKERGVELLADRVVAFRRILALLEECRELFERLAGRRARVGQALPRGRVGHFRGHELARVFRRGLGLTDGALEVDAWRARDVDVGDAVLDVLRDLREPRTARRPQDLSPDEGDGGKARTRRSAPGSDTSRAGAATSPAAARAAGREHRDEQVPVDRAAAAKVGLAHARETSEPGVVRLDTLAERRPQRCRPVARRIPSTKA